MKQRKHRRFELPAIVSQAGHAPGQGQHLHPGAGSIASRKTIHRKNAENCKIFAIESGQLRIFANRFRA